MLLPDLPCVKNFNSPSQDGWKLVKYGNHSLLIYDSNGRTFLEIQRTNANPLREEMLAWTAEDKLLLYCRGSDNAFRDVVVFQIK